MTPIQVLQIIVGIPLALFIPGYLLVRLVFKKFHGLEKLLLGVVFSMIIDVIVVLYLGYDEGRKIITGGITTYNLWTYLGSLTIILFVLWLVIRRDEVKHVLNSFKKLFERH